MIKIFVAEKEEKYVYLIFKKQGASISISGRFGREKKIFFFSDFRIVASGDENTSKEKWEKFEKENNKMS